MNTHCIKDSCSEHDLTLSVVFLTKDNGFASLNNLEVSCLGLGAFELKHNLLGLLCLLSEDRFGLTTETLLFHIISSLTLGSLGSLTGFVLRNFMNSVLFGLWAISSNLLWDMDHFAFLLYLTN